MKISTALLTINVIKAMNQIILPLRRAHGLLWIRLENRRGHRYPTVITTQRGMSSDAEIPKFTLYTY
jgi:hypothetical protein